MKKFLATLLLLAVGFTLCACDNGDESGNTNGGGANGQAGAISHALARALEKMDANLRAVLKKAGLITRDGRAKERKKSGQPGARKRFQFSKR